MSGQCSLASHAETACDDLSLQSLRPFFGDPCDDGSMRVCAANELNDFLSSRPLTTIRHMKYGKQRQKYEYHHCRCGCSFCINVHYSVDGQTCHVNVGTIPDDHLDVDENPDKSGKDKEVGKFIDALIIEHCFAKNNCLHHIISGLHHQNIPDYKIPAQKQLENRLYYFQKQKFGYHNEIGPLEEKLRKFVFSGDEADEQAFIYHYQTDRHDRLYVGDGSDK
jgi:hypothetical protein